MGTTLPDLTAWWLFVAASLVLLLTPGPAVLFIVTYHDVDSRSRSQSLTQASWAVARKFAAALS
jgi:threonine/homoserine/homoserine lactone efflux protein